MKGRLIAAFLVFGWGAGHAQDSSRTLAEVVVTATKFPVKQSETGKVIDVITSDQLEKSYGKSLGEILNQQPGLVINGADNTPGTNQTVYLQGASAGNTLIMMDGIPLYDASGITSEFDLNNFSLNNIEKIEILKGPQSTLYGSDAVAGVINIITKKGSKKPFSFQGGVSAGSYGTWKGDVSFSGAGSKGQSYFISYSKMYSNGFSSAYDSTGKMHFDRDGFDQDVIQASYGFKPFKKTSLRFFGKYNNNRADIDAGAFMDDKDYTYHNNNIIAGAAADYKLDNGFIRLQYSYNRFNRNFVDDSTDVGGYSQYQKGKYNGTSHFAEIYTSLALGKSLELLAGADYRQQATSQLYIYVPDYGFPALPVSADSAHTQQLSAYASLVFRQKKGFQAELGGRWNHHSIYHDNFTYSFNPFYLIGSHYKLFANLSSGYRVPSLYQLYSEYGNRKLKPETTTGYEAGLQYFSDKFRARVTGFLRQGKQVILFYTDPTTYASYYTNGDRQHDYGIETEVSVALTSRLSAIANYTCTDGEIITQAASGKDTSFYNLYKRPKNIFNLSLNYEVTKKLYFSTHLKIAGKAYEPQYQASPYVLDGYYTWDVYGRYQFGSRVGIFADFRNITDQEYFVTRGFTTKGFNVNAGVRVSL